MAKGKALSVAVVLAVAAGGWYVAHDDVQQTLESLSSASHDVAPVTDGTFTLIQHPGSDFSMFYDAIKSAKKSISMEMYELADDNAEHALAEAAGRGVNVRVILDQEYHGKRANEDAFKYLKDHGVKVRWSRPGEIYHIKATTFDHQRTFVSTGNLTAHYYEGTRDATVVTTSKTQVKAIEQTFNHDWAGKPTKGSAVQAPGLVWSPRTNGRPAESAMVRQISKAKKSVRFMSEELKDEAVVNALASAARSGVKCQVVMTYDSDWGEGFRKVANAGCAVHTFKDDDDSLYVHEKAIITDAGNKQASVLIGSHNASWTSLNKNRELSLVVTKKQAPQVVKAITSTFRNDFHTAPSWREVA